LKLVRLKQPRDHLRILGVETMRVLQTVGLLYRSLQEHSSLAGGG
jgi:hypothetical protein